MQDATSRFERGAKLLKELEHPKIVKLLDYFFENGKAYLVMEYVKGETLRDYIDRKGAMPFDEGKKLGLQLCEILEFLHERDTPVIHCDFAPDNLIITPDGDVKLIDFDVARVVESKAHTFIAGRPSYTPPEQFRGQPTPQSDLFALGAILHYLLQGKDPPPLCAGESDDDTVWNSTGVEQLIQQCCRFEASERPKSAGEIKETLLSCELQQAHTTIDARSSEERGQRISVSIKVEENA
jgi:serine/threonine-protein kinase